MERNNNEYFFCEKCSLRFDIKIEYYQHLLFTHKIKVNVKSANHELVTTEEGSQNVKARLKVTPPFTCGIGKDEFTRNDGKSHKSQITQVTEKNVTKSIGTSFFAREICQDEFVKINEKSLNTQVTEKIIKSNDTLVTSRKNSKSEYKCSICVLTFSRPCHFF